MNDEIRQEQIACLHQIIHDQNWKNQELLERIVCLAEENAEVRTRLGILQTLLPKLLEAVPLDQMLNIIMTAHIAENGSVERPVA